MNTSRVFIPNLAPNSMSVANLYHYRHYVCVEQDAGVTQLVCTTMYKNSLVQILDIRVREREPGIDCLHMRQKSPEMWGLGLLGPSMYKVQSEQICDRCNGCSIVLLTVIFRTSMTLFIMWVVSSSRHSRPAINSAALTRASVSKCSLGFCLQLQARFVDGS